MRIPVPPLAFGLFVLFTGVFAGQHWGLYERIPHLDDLLHLSGGLAVAWMLWAALDRSLAPLPRHLQALFIVAATCLVGVLWEFAEYVSNFAPLWWYRYLHSGDLADTMADLLADLLGAAAFLFATFRPFRAR
jgi:hypothetical protein